MWVNHHISFGVSRVGKRAFLYPVSSLSCLPCTFCFSLVEPTTLNSSESLCLPLPSAPSSAWILLAPSPPHLLYIWESCLPRTLIPLSLPMQRPSWYCGSMVDLLFLTKHSDFSSCGISYCRRIFTSPTFKSREWPYSLLQPMERGGRERCHFWAEALRASSWLNLFSSPPCGEISESLLCQPGPLREDDM